MVSWIVIVILILVSLFLLEFKDIKHRFFLFIIIIFLLFLFVSLSIVYFNYDLDLKSFDSLVKSGKIYFTWVSNFFSNFKDISGYAVKHNWGVNSTIGK